MMTEPLLEFPMQPVELPEEGRLYLHYKGGLYRMLVIGRFSEDRKSYGVVYKSMERGHVWIRPLDMFLEVVMWPDGVRRPRFIPKPLDLPGKPANQQQ